MQNKLNLFLVTVGLCLMSSVAGFAQNQGATRGNLSVTVLDTTKAVVPAASVTITGPIGIQTQSTNDQGTFVFSALVPGSYTVKVEKSGFAVITVPNIEVLINNTASVNVTLQTATVTAQIEVSATSVATVDTGSTSINSDLSNTLTDNIPVQRNVSAIMMLAPGVVSGLGTSSSLSPATVHTVVGSPASFSNPSISGASGLENLYVADGVVLNDPSYGGLGGFSTVYGALGVGITPAFVKEEEVKTAGFEPQYGHATGGVVQIVTKSGSDHLHGTVGGYFETPGMQTAFLNKDNFNPANELGSQLDNGEYEGDFELGGYVPGLKNHLYYFGAFDPTWFNDYEAPAVGFGLYTIYNGKLDRKTTTYAYAAKLTYKINDSINVEASVFGDPSNMPTTSISTLTANNTTGASSWNYGTRNLDARLYASITPTWEADFAYSYAWNHFTETPAVTGIYPIEDLTQTAGLTGQVGQYQALGLGTAIIVNYQSHSQAISFDTLKTVNFAGTHTFSLGYFWQFPTYDNITNYSPGISFPIPATNASGGGSGMGSAIGKMSDASLQLELAPSTCTICPLMNIPGYTTPQAVYLYQVRGRFDGGISDNTGKYHAAFVNDAWKMSPHVTLNLGLRWEQQRLTGVSPTNGTLNAVFNDMWSPRVGFVVSPNPDSKIFVDFDRLGFVLPLDMAVRELGGETDDLGGYWAPASNPVTHMVTLNSSGTVNFVPDGPHLLNGATGGVSSPYFVSSSGEPFVPGTKMEYNDEWVAGAEHKFSGGFTASARYIDRRMKRVVEDMTGQSVEEILATGAYNYFIGNPSASFAHFVTPNEITWMPTAAEVSAYQAALAGGAASIVADAALGPPAGCFDSGGNLTPFNSGPVYDTFKTLRGAACFPAVNGVLNTSSSALVGGEYYPGACPKGPGGRSLCQPGLYPNVQRNYQAVEFEVNKTFSSSWQLHSNFRIAKLAGNYEGAFRNDNNQSDPGISSLFDLTTGELGLLGQQLGIGPLNTDRKFVLNVEPSYAIPTGIARNLVLGAALNVESGIPLTTLAAQQAYGNPGEVPIFGRGDLGRSPTTGTIDAHIEYPIRISEGKQLKLQFDAFNIANTKRSILSTEQVDLSFQVPNQDFTNHVPLSFVPPFSSRAAIMFTF
jgi:carboxypeptidase family protein